MGPDPIPLFFPPEYLKKSASRYGRGIFSETVDKICPFHTSGIDKK
jgi:hypothetical protein